VSDVAWRVAKIVPIIGIDFDLCSIPWLWFKGKGIWTNGLYEYLGLMMSGMFVSLWVMHIYLRAQAIALCTATCFLQTNYYI